MPSINDLRTLVIVSINLILHFGVDIGYSTYLLLKSPANFFAINQSNSLTPQNLLFVTNRAFISFLVKVEKKILQEQ